jgi:hypothetical protein
MGTGEGSRGGKVIGHTSSGKAVYASEHDESGHTATATHHRESAKTSHKAMLSSVGTPEFGKHVHEFEVHSMLAAHHNKERDGLSTQRIATQNAERAAADIANNAHFDGKGNFANPTPGKKVPVHYTGGATDYGSLTHVTDVHMQGTHPSSQKEGWGWTTGRAEAEILPKGQAGYFSVHDRGERGEIDHVRSTGHTTREEAQAAAKGQGWYGSDADVYEHHIRATPDGTPYVLHGVGHDAPPKVKKSLSGTEEKNMSGLNAWMKSSDEAADEELSGTDMLLKAVAFPPEPAERGDSEDIDADADAKAESEAAAQDDAADAEMDKSLDDAQAIGGYWTADTEADFRKSFGDDAQAFVEDGLVKAGGPFMGPHGGKWADPGHKIPWNEKKHAGKPAPVAKEHDKHGADNLAMISEHNVRKMNMSDFHRASSESQGEHMLANQKESIHKNLVNKMAAGTYDHAQATKLWGYHAKAVSDHAKKHGLGGGEDPATRLAAAKQMADSFVASAKNGEHDHLLNGKHTKAMKKTGAKNAYEHGESVKKTKAANFVSAVSGKDYKTPHMLANEAKNAAPTAPQAPAAAPAPAQAAPAGPHPAVQAAFEKVKAIDTSKAGFDPGKAMEHHDALASFQAAVQTHHPDAVGPKASAAVGNAHANVLARANMGASTAALGDKDRMSAASSRAHFDDARAHAHTVMNALGAKKPFGKSESEDRMNGDLGEWLEKAGGDSVPVAKEVKLVSDIGQPSASGKLDERDPVDLPINNANVPSGTEIGTSGKSSKPDLASPPPTESLTDANGQPSKSGDIEGGPKEIKTHPVAVAKSTAEAFAIMRHKAGVVETVAIGPASMQKGGLVHFSTGTDDACEALLKSKGETGLGMNERTSLGMTGSPMQKSVKCACGASHSAYVTTCPSCKRASFG